MQNASGPETRYLGTIVWLGPLALQRPQVQLHIAVFLFGFTAILGDLISLGGVVLVAYRVGLAALGFGVWLRAQRQSPKLPVRDVLTIVGIGLVLVVHWITFFDAIKRVGPSVTLVCLASATFITALVEPLITGRRFVRRELGLGVVVIVGIYLIFRFTPEANVGILIALLSAALSALVGILNKTIVSRYPGLVINFWQMSGSFVLLVGYLAVTAWGKPAAGLLPQPLDWLWLALLAFLCTNYAYQLAIRALRHLSAFQMILAINLEPLYGIVLATLLLGENRDLSWGLVLGMLLVLGAVFFNAALTAWQAWRLRRRLGT